MKSLPWQWLRALHIAAVITSAATVYQSGPSWIGMLFAAAIGFNLGAMVWLGSSFRWRRLYEEMEASFNHDALIHDRVMFHLFGESPPPDAADEHKPRLH